MDHMVKRIDDHLKDILIVCFYIDMCTSLHQKMTLCFLQKEGPIKRFKINITITLTLP